jgi:hypothetical protein
MEPGQNEIRQENELGRSGLNNQQSSFEDTLIQLDLLILITYYK